MWRIYALVTFTDVRFEQYQRQFFASSVHDATYGRRGVSGEDDERTTRKLLPRRVHTVCWTLKSISKKEKRPSRRTWLLPEVQLKICYADHNIV